MRLEFVCLDSPTSQVFLKLDHVVDLVLQVDIKLLSNSSLTVTLESRDSKELFYLHYISSDVHISAVVGASSYKKYLINVTY